MPINLESARRRLQNFKFQELFIEDLGWSQFSGAEKHIKVQDQEYTLSPIAELSGVVVFEILAADGEIPEARLRRDIHHKIAKGHQEHLLIFIKGGRTAADWYWVKRDGRKEYPRDHFYFRGQTGDLILGKLHDMVFDLTDFDEDGNVPIVEVTRRLATSLDIERVTKKFYGEFKDIHLQFVEYIHGIEDERDRKWYASVILNRLMFVYFLQKKGFVDHNTSYLDDKFKESQARGPDRFFSEFLQMLFFEGFAKRKPSDKAKLLLGDVRYLNGGLFLRHALEQKYEDRIVIPDMAFACLFALFKGYSWHLDDRPSGKDDEINPDVLGYIFEKYINQKQFGAYYTRPEITEYLCDHTINEVVVRKINERLGRKYQSIEEILLQADAAACRALLCEDGILSSLSLLDPSCGSGAFLIAALKTLVNVYSALIGRIEFLKDEKLTTWLRDLQTHRSVSYEVKKRIITDNLYGVDIMEEAVEICKLRLFLALVASVETVAQLEPLPNIDFNVMAGNSLIGLLRVEEGDLALFSSPDRYRSALKEKNELIDGFRHATSSATSEDIEHLKTAVEQRIAPLRTGLDEVLYHHFCDLGIFYQQAITEKKFKKRALELSDIQALKPFHWGFEFDEIMQKRGGFDAIITNPPWEVFQTDQKEFFQQYENTIQKKKIRIEDWNVKFEQFMQDSELRSAWLDYASSFPHVQEWLKKAIQYQNQQSYDSDGKKIASKANLYKVFLEQCFNLLAEGGRCGIICQGSISSDLGAKQLRIQLLEHSVIHSLFGLSNEKYIFEGVHHAQKLCILVFAKGNSTNSFEAAFRINPREAISPDKLGEFFRDNDSHVRIDADLIKSLAPESFSIIEFREQADIDIAKKMLRFPHLGAHIKGKWNLHLAQELNMTSDSGIFKNKPETGRLPLYEGKMIWQFDHNYSSPRYWVNETEGRRTLLGATRDDGQFLTYQRHRLAFRDVASNTNERTMICTILPKNVFCSHPLPEAIVYTQEASLADYSCSVYLAAVMNSFIVDYLLRYRVTMHLTFFFLYQLPVPRLTKFDSEFSLIVRRAARLICTTQEFDDLAKEVGLGSHVNGATDPIERARLRAELDGLIAHIYGLTEDEFAHILSTFPLISEPVKVAAQNAYRDIKRGLIS